MANDTDKLEQTLTAIFGALGMAAILINLHLKGYEATNILDTIKDVAGLVVVITVFLVANKMFRRGEKPNFNKMFEDALKVWIAQNAYLMSEHFDGDGKGNDKKRYCAMVIDHANFVTEKKLASDAAKNTEKATFVRLPEKDKKELDFRFNDRTFERQTTYRKDNKVDLGAILDQFSARINKTFGDIGINARADKNNKSAVIVSFEGIEETEENARKLVDIVEFVKTMVLALA